MFATTSSAAAAWITTRAPIIAAGTDGAGDGPNQDAAATINFDGVQSLFLWAGAIGLLIAGVAIIFASKSLKLKDAGERFGVAMVGIVMIAVAGMVSVFAAIVQHGAKTVTG